MCLERNFVLAMGCELAIYWQQPSEKWVMFALGNNL
jgi:hypothetical protein